MPERKQRTEINLDDEHDRRKWRCPLGHMSWTPTNCHFWCESCSKSWDVDPEFEQLTNDVTGETLERHEVTLTTEVGHYKTLYKNGQA